MKKKYFRLIPALMICVGTILFAAAVFAAVVDKIVVVVNNEIITQREIDVTLAPVYEQYKAIYKGAELIKKLEEAREQIIKQLIEDRLILSEAKKSDITVDEKEADAKLAEVRNRAGGEAELEKMLNAQNLTVNELRARFKEKIMIRKLIDKKVGAKIIVTPLEVKTYYNDHNNEFLQSEEIQLRQILIKPKGGPGGQEEALKKIREISSRIREGGDFGGLAKVYSDGPNPEGGGDMGYMKKGVLLPQVEEIVYALKDGEASGIVQSSLGYHIFKVEGRRPRRTKELSEVRQEIEEMLYRDKANQKLKGWIDSLSKNAYIEFK